MLTLDHVSYKYKGGVQAITDANTEIGPGTYLLIGSNGAGKTTLLRLLSTLLFATEGEVKLDGRDITLRRPEDMKQIFYMPDDLKSPMPTIAELEKRHACFYPSFNPELLRANLTDFGLTGTEKLDSLSLGMRRKSLLAYALSLGVKYLLLDEPANGMDIDSKKIFMRMINRCVSDDSTLVIATHNIHELSSMFTHLLYLDKGRLSLSISIPDLLERIAFVTSPSPVQGAAYQEPFGGLFHAVIANEDGLDTEIDFPLLFSALTSAAGHSLADFINRYNPRSHEF
ncbi:MAG: ATP-binding cassette domain-containing protein [Muribaculaceae bacterium]|nr:ATP-binding cassette domain-containing protein [Muribaculaceae bacterium]